jgi:hypothetical protein
MANPLRPWNAADHQALAARTEALAACPAKLFRLQRGRNAWWGTWSKSRYDVYASLKDAKDGVKGHRTQGSTWTILDLPVVAFLGRDLTLVVGENTMRSALLGTSFRRPNQPYLSAIAKAFEPTRARSYFRYAVVGAQLGLGASPCRIHRSGGSYPFPWPARLSEADFHGALEIVSAFAESAGA